jgi:hypothetical protein
MYGTMYGAKLAATHGRLIKSERTKNTPSVQCFGRGRQIKTKFLLAINKSKRLITPLEIFKNLHFCGIYGHFYVDFCIFVFEITLLLVVLERKDKKFLSKINKKIIVSENVIFLSDLTYYVKTCL